MDGSLKKIRFGVADSKLRSLSFSLSKYKEDAYLSCREFGVKKYSFHESGIHRLAENKNAPRKPIDTTTLLRLRPKRFWTVAKILLTTRIQWSEGDSFRDMGKEFFAIEPPDRREFAMVALGFLPHHPREYSKTDLPGNFAVLKISDEKFAVLTLSVVKQSEYLNRFYENLAMHERSNPVIEFHRLPGQSLFHSLCSFRSHRNTYVMWGHHNLEMQTDQWFGNHRIGKEVLRGKWDLITGRFSGVTRLDGLDMEAPDWEAQVLQIRKPVR